jgi:hypothetical protein
MVPISNVTVLELNKEQQVTLSEIGDLLLKGVSKGVNTEPFPEQGNSNAPLVRGILVCFQLEI